MRHKVKKNRLSRSLGQRKALTKALLRALIINERVKTTTAKAKFIKPYFDKIIALAKDDTLAARRLAFSRIGNHSLVKKLFDEIVPRFKGTSGSCCRIYRIGFRGSDGAPLSLIELTKKSEKKNKIKTKRKAEKEPAEEKEESPRKEKGVSGLKKMFKKKKKS